MADEKTIEEKIAELQEQRAKKRIAKSSVEAEQFAKDLEALIDLETEHDTVRAVKVNFIEGQPTRAFLRAPTRAEYQRYRDTVGKAVKKDNAKAQTEAQDQLAKSVWIYPREQKDKDLMLESTPGLLAHIWHEATKLAEGKAEEEGKD